MTNLTPSEARRLIDKLHHNQTKDHGISILEEKYLAALEIALTVLEGRIATSTLPEEAFNRLYDQHLMGVICGKGNKSAAEGFLNACVVALYDSPNTPPKPKTDTYRQIENDAWIEWKGVDECPVSLVTRVEVKFRNGEVNSRQRGNDWAWKRTNEVPEGFDIIAYRVIENDGREG